MAKFGFFVFLTLAMCALIRGQIPFSGAMSPTGMGTGMGMGSFTDVDPGLPSEALPILRSIRRSPENVRYLPQLLYYHGMLL